MGDPALAEVIGNGTPGQLRWSRRSCHVSLYHVIKSSSRSSGLELSNSREFTNEAPHREENNFHTHSPFTVHSPCALAAIHQTRKKPDWPVAALVHAQDTVDSPDS